ncbi:MAG: alpha/beta hydrolase [Streptosporangiales bacterium]|nr:alpha/beta hydrolase [Streptosporangiales bacterium]
MRRPPQALESAAARLVTALPGPLRRGLAGPPIGRDGLVLDPQVQLVLALRERRGVVPLDRLAPREARDVVAREALTLCGRAPDVTGVTDLEVDGATGPLAARLYRTDEADAPLLVYFHGGGFVTCGLDTHDVPCRTLCRHAGVHVLSAEYRQAPEHPFPAAVDDACAVFAWAVKNAADLGADEGRVAVGGDSAGGTLAAVVSRLTTRAGDPPPAAQLLVYPATDRLGTHASMRTFATGYYLTAADIAWYHAQYAGPGGDRRGDPRMSPLLANDLGGLPPAVVVTAGFDPLRDEGEAYAAKLRAAGTPATSRRFPSLVHGFMHMTGASRAARDALVETGGMLRGALSPAHDDRRAP